MESVLKEILTGIKNKSQNLEEITCGFKWQVEEYVSLENRQRLIIDLKEKVEGLSELLNKLEDIK